jgi:hypothetical protein
LRGKVGFEGSEMLREIGDIFITAGGISNNVKLFATKTSYNGVIDDTAGCRVEEDGKSGTMQRKRVNWSRCEFFQETGCSRTGQTMLNPICENVSELVGENRKEHHDEGWEQTCGPHQRGWLFPGSTCDFHQLRDQSIALAYCSQRKRPFSRHVRGGGHKVLCFSDLMVLLKRLYVVSLSARLCIEVSILRRN